MVGGPPRWLSAGGARRSHDSKACVDFPTDDRRDRKLSLCLRCIIPCGFCWSAIVLFVLEVFIPSGGILGVLSTVGFIAAIGAAFAYGGLQMGTAFMAGTAVLIPVLIYLLIKLWPKTPFGKRILIELPDSGSGAARSSAEHGSSWSDSAVSPSVPCYPPVRFVFRGERSTRSATG